MCLCQKKDENFHNNAKIESKKKKKKPKNIIYKNITDWRQFGKKKFII
jgi:hypothetical protein